MQEVINTDVLNKLNKIEAEVKLLLVVSKTRNEKLLKESDSHYHKIIKIFITYGIVNLILVTISIYMAIKWTT